MVEDRDGLDDDRYAQLEEIVTRTFGRSLAVAIGRGRLGFASEIAETSPPPEPEPAAVAADPEPVMTPVDAPPLEPTEPRRAEPSRWSSATPLELADAARAAAPLELAEPALELQTDEATAAIDETAESLRGALPATRAGERDAHALHRTVRSAEHRAHR